MSLEHDIDKEVFCNSKLLLNLFIENEWRAFKKRTGIQSSLKIEMIATRIMKKFSLAAMPVSHRPKNIPVECNEHTSEACYL